jgi:hypothetical protein
MPEGYYPRPSLAERAWRKITQGPMLSPYLGPCWDWTGGKKGTRYGGIVIGDGDPRRAYAHRVVYELVRGPVPEGLELDHLCRRRFCVNPAHLEAVTHTENVRRGEASKVSSARQRAKTHCPRGHPYDAANTYIAPRGSRTCRRCGREYTRLARHAKHDALAASLTHPKED